MRGSYLFSSESVTEGHPDKLADRISDAILDSMLRVDSSSRVACETLVTTGLVMVSGEITTGGWVDIPAVVRSAITDVGYTNARFGLDGETCGVITAIQEQSPDIARGVEDSVEHRERHSGDELDLLGAGDQGMMFGFACRETEDLMPLPIAMAHRLARRLADVRKAGVVPYLRPDGKSQVSIEYEDRRPVRVDSVLISAQHREEVDVETLLKPDVIAEVIDPVLREFPDVDATTMKPPMSTATAGWRRTVAEPSAGRTPRRWIARRRTWRGTWRRTSWPRGSRTGSSSRWRTRSAPRIPRR